MRRSLLTIGTAIGALLAPAAASAATFVVDATANSVLSTPSTAGTGVSTGIMLTSGQTLSVWANASDLWSSGALPRWSNANGQIANLLATGTDDSGQTLGTLIGEATAAQTINGFTANVGALVGEIGGVYQTIGTGFQGAAWGTGELKLYYWDLYAADNSNSISVAAAVPEPATWALMMAGFGILGFGLRRRTATASRVSFKFA